MVHPQRIVFEICYNTKNFKYAEMNLPNEGTLIWFCRREGISSIVNTLQLIDAFGRLALQEERLPLNPNSTGWGQSDLDNFDVKFRTKILYNILDFFIWPVPAETSSKSFWTFDMTSKNYVLTSILTFFHHKFCRVGTLPSSPLLTGFTAITDHPSAGEVLPGRGP